MSKAAQSAHKGGVAAAKSSRLAIYIVIGIAAGLLSGLFGIGGGTIIVPGLVLCAGMSQRLAAGTSVTAILPTSIVGAATYGVYGNVEWFAAVCLALGIILGAQFGSALLARLSNKILQGSFIVYLVATIVGLWLFVPQRDQTLQMTWTVALLLVATGLLAGVLSGIMGVGGGIVVVPTLMIFFGTNDLSSKGTSLVMMVPGSLSATIGNGLRRNLNLKAALLVGLGACVSAPLGVFAASWLTPLAANILFSVYLALICAHMVIDSVRKKRMYGGTRDKWHSSLK